MGMWFMEMAAAPNVSRSRKLKLRYNNWEIPVDFWAIRDEKKWNLSQAPQIRTREDTKDIVKSMNTLGRLLN